MPRRSVSDILAELQEGSVDPESMMDDADYEDIDESFDSGPAPSPEDDFWKLTARANAGDPIAIQQLKRVLDDNPHLWKEAANLGRFVEQKLIKRAADDSVLVAESLKYRLAELHRELAGTYSSPILALAAERVTTNWLHVQVLELENASSSNDRTTPEGRWRLRHLDQAHRRFLSALKMLTTLQGRPLAASLSCGSKAETQTGVSMPPSIGPETGVNSPQRTES